MIALAWLVSYFIGSLPTAYVLVRVVKGVDIRTVGSGNVGATNAARAVGPWAGLVVFSVDVLKGVVAVAGVSHLFVREASTAIGLSCGLAAVIGHDFPVFLRFRGGKGVSTTIGALVAGQPLIAAVLVGVWVVVFALCRYVSVASMAAALTIPLAQLAWHHPPSEILLGAGFAVLLVVQHRSNIQRLFAGAEPRGLSRPRG